MSWSQPLMEGVRVLDDIDTWVVQIVEKPEVTDDRQDPPDLTYTFVKLDRATEDDGLRKKIVKDKLPEYTALWRKSQQAWDKLSKALSSSNGRNVEDLLKMTTQHCLDFLGIRRAYREELDLKLRSHRDLYKASTRCLQCFMDYRSNLAYIMLHPDVDAEDAVWELYKGVDGYNPVQAPEDVEVVICTVGAVCPRAYERKNPGALQKFIDEIWWPEDEKPVPGDRAWYDCVKSQMISYGAYANLEEEVFLHEDDALPWARERLKNMSFMLGFALDRQANAIGSTGWDFLSGDITAGLYRKAPKGRETEHELMRKISGIAEPHKEPESSP